MFAVRICIGLLASGVLLLPARPITPVNPHALPDIGAEIPKPILLWEQGAPRATGDSNEDKPAVYAFLPDPAKNTGAAILVCPGGGNQTRCVDYEGVVVAQYFRQRGIAAFVLRYRIAPLYTGAETRLDTQRGIQFLRANAEKFNISPDRIGAIGFSAGASNICAATFNALPAIPDSPDPVARVSSSPNFLVPVYGSSTLPDATTSPLPPTFMYCTAEDSAINGMVTMYTALRKKGVPTEIHFFEKGPHGVGFATGDPVLGVYPDMLYNWIRQKGFLTAEKRLAVQGIVKLDGEALPHGVIVFHPLDKVGAAPAIGYITNTGMVRGEYKIAANVGLVPGKYRVEVYQDAVHWLSNANNPMVAKFKLLKNGTDAQKKEVADYARSRNLEPTIDNVRVYRKARPNDIEDNTVEVKAGASNRFDIQVASK